MPEDVLPSPRPSSSLLAGAVTSPHRLVSVLKPAASFVLEALPGPAATGDGEETTRAPQTLDICTASPKLPILPLSSCWPGWLAAFWAAGRGDHGILEAGGSGLMLPG